MIDIFRSADDIDPGLAIAFNDLSAGPNSQLDYIAIQALNEVTRIIQINETSTARDASAKGFILNTGASWARNESLSRLEGPGSRSDMLSVSHSGPRAGIRPAHLPAPRFRRRLLGLAL